MKLFPLRSLFTVACCLALVGSLRAQYTFDVAPGQSNFSWTGSVSVGDLEECSSGSTTGNFRIDGTVIVALDPPQAPFNCGQLQGGLGFTVPTDLCAEVPNPIIFLPPLVRIDITGMELSVSSPEFTVNAGGNFDTDVTATILNGTVTIDPFVGNTEVIDLAGFVGEPTPITGSLAQVGSQLQAQVPLIIDINEPELTFSLNGVLTATADEVDPMSLTVGTLTAGSTGNFDVTNGAPNADTFLFYSVAGPGCTGNPAMNNILSIANPIQVPVTIQTDGSGAGGWVLNIPANSSGTNVWVQAAQMSLASDVVNTTVQ